MQGLGIMQSLGIIQGMSMRQGLGHKHYTRSVADQTPRKPTLESGTPEGYNMKRAA